MGRVKTRRQLLTELNTIKSRHQAKISKSATKRDALYHQGILSIISYSLAAVKHHRLRTVLFGYHSFSGTSELRRELEAKQDKASQQRAWREGNGYWTLAQEHAGEALACETLVRMMGG